MSEQFLIVGLGNPGEQYEGTRHNVGFAVLDALAGDSWWRKESGIDGLVAESVLNKAHIVLLKPQTYMNKSGQAVATAGKRFGVPVERIIVVHDDIDLPFGAVRVSQGRGSGGHNGVQSVIDALGTNAFVRVRVGIAPMTLFGTMKKPRGKDAVSAFVLKRFGLRESRAFPELINRAADEMRAFIEKSGKV